jgi:hypothetical protein
VAQVPATERLGVGRPGRWASRALLVLGGVAVGTAAAWAVSTATAASSEKSATGATVTVTPVADATGAILRERTHGVAQFIGDAGGDVADRATKLDDLANSAVIHPVERPLGAAQDARRVLNSLALSADGPDFGKKVWDLLSRHGRDNLIPLHPVPHSPVENGATPEASDAVYGAVPNAGPAAGELRGAAEVPLASRLARGADVARSHNRTTWHSGQGDFSTPFRPAGVPTAPLPASAVPGAPGFAPGGHFDGPTSGVAVWFSAAHDNAKGGTVRSCRRYMPLTPGAQPGVTPD